MTEEQAREWIEGMRCKISDKGIEGDNPYVLYENEGDAKMFISVYGRFFIEELEALVWWARKEDPK